MKIDHQQTVADVARRNGGLDVFATMYEYYRPGLQETFLRGYSVKADLQRPLPVELLRQCRTAMHSFFDGIRLAVEESAGRPPRGNKGPACRIGCHFCCHQHLYISTTEIAMILDHLVTNPADAERTIARALRMAPMTNRMDRTQRFAAGVPCPALGPGGLCTLYEARPQACATYFSFSRTACEAGFRKRARPSQRLRGIPIAGEAQAFGHTLVAGFDAAFLETGFEVELVEFTEALAFAAELPGGIAGTLERWLQGEPQFTTIACAEPARHATIINLEKAQWL